MVPCKNEVDIELCAQTWCWQTRKFDNVRIFGYDMKCDISVSGLVAARITIYFCTAKATVTLVELAGHFWGGLKSLVQRLFIQEQLRKKRYVF